MATTSFSFLGIESLHVIITGAARGIGRAAVTEFINNGARVTALDINPLDVAGLELSPEEAQRVNSVLGDITNEASLRRAFAQAEARFSPPNILVANAGTTDESTHPAIWEMDAAKWDRSYHLNVRGTFLTIKQFLLSVKAYQDASKTELDNVAIVVTGSDVGLFGQAGHAEYTSGKAALQYGLVRGVKNEIVRLNAQARINAVVPGYVESPLVGDSLADPVHQWAETQATVALKRASQMADVARAMAFLASHRAAGQLSGECLGVHGGMEGRLLWRQEEVLGQTTKEASSVVSLAPRPTVPQSLRPPSRKRRLRIALSVDFDALSGYLGTGHSEHNTMSDYATGIFSAHVGVGRLLRLFEKYKVADKLTWFIPGHTIETFPEQTAQIVASGAEIALHAYSHEGAYALTEKQERDMIQKCVDLVLREHNFLYDSSLSAHDSLPYLLPDPFPMAPPVIPDYSKDAASWMVPTQIHNAPEPGTAAAANALVEVPVNYYTEDMKPLGFYPYAPNTQGYVAVDVVEKIWWDRFLWLWENESFVDNGPGKGYGSIFPMLWHPESAGRLHIVGTIDKFIGKLVTWMQAAEDGEITFDTTEAVARSWKEKNN